MLSLVLATAITAIVVPLLLWKFSARRGPDLSHLPIINPDGSRFVNEATKLAQEGMAKVRQGPGCENFVLNHAKTIEDQFDKRPFRIATPQGEKIMLDTSLVDVVKSDPRLNIDKFTQKARSRCIPRSSCNLILTVHSRACSPTCGGLKSSQK